MRDAAIAVLAKHQVPSLLTARADRERELTIVERELAAVAEKVSWWDRGLFSGGSPDAERARQLEEATARARAARDAAAAAADRAAREASRELPPIEIAFSVERVIATVLAQPMLGRGPTSEAPALAGELERIADRVVAIWVPRFDDAQVARELLDDGARRAAASRVTGSPRADARLGWAAIEPAELVARAAAALSNRQFRDARAHLQREAAEHGAAIRQVAEARQRIGLGDKLSFGLSDNAQHLALAEQVLAKEQHEHLAASEALHHAVQRALGAYPPMGIFIAALGAAGILQAALEGTEHTIVVPTGEVFPAPSASLRAILLAALVELRRATDAAFPGLGALVSGRGGPRDARDFARAAAGAVPANPYRAGAATDDEPPPAAPRAQDVNAWLAAAIERTDVRAGLGRALAHGAIVGMILRSQGEPESRTGWADKLGFWSASSAKDEREARVHWHRAVAFGLGNAALASVAQAARPLGVVRIRNGIVEAQVALKRVATRGHDLGYPASCRLYGLAEAVAAVDQLGGELSRTWGPRGTKSSFAYDVVQHLSTSPRVAPPARPGTPLRPLSYREIVVTAAEALRGSDFVAIEARLRHAGAEASRAHLALRESASRVTLWDRINVLTKSMSEEQRDAWDERVRSIAQAMSADLARAEALLDGALVCYPPAILYYELGGVHARVADIRAVLRTYGSGTQGDPHTYRCDLLGKAAAVNVLCAWTRKALWVFGAMPADGELLERFVARELG